MMDIDILCFEIILSYDIATILRFIFISLREKSLYFIIGKNFWSTSSVSFHLP